MGEFVPGFEASQWVGICAPKNTPTRIVETLNREIDLGLAEPAIKARIANLGGTVLPGSPGEFGKFTADEVDKWAKVIKFANITAE